MKRVKSACIYQTLCFLQKEDYGLTKEQALKYNREEVAKYKADMDKNKTRYQILDETENEDGSITVRVKKQYNATISVDEYFN